MGHAAVENTKKKKRKLLLVFKLELWVSVPPFLDKLLLSAAHLWCSVSAVYVRAGSLQRQESTKARYFLQMLLWPGKLRYCTHNHYRILEHFELYFL